MNPLKFTPLWGGVPNAPSRRSVMRRSISLDNFFSLLPVASLALVLVCLTSALLLCEGSSAFAQEVTASITGTVTDPSGAAVSGATVTAKSVERGLLYTAVTNDSGIYRIAQLPVGKYEVKVEKQGFASASVPEFVLSLNQVARIDVGLKVGEVSETVDVTGATSASESEV